MPRKKTDNYTEVFDYYFLCNLDITQTLKYFHFLDGKSKRTPREQWKDLVYNHRQEYEESKLNYYGEIGISEHTLLERLNSISENGRSEKNRLDATTYLLEYLDRKYPDTKVEQKANKLIIEFEEKKDYGVEGGE